MRLFRSPLTTFFEARGDQWFFGRSARALFFVSTLLVISVTWILWVVELGHLPFWPNLIVGLVGIGGTLSIFFLWIGMWRYWTRIDASSRWVKRLWFLILLIGFCWGAVLYCYVIYLPQSGKQNLPFNRSDEEIAPGDHYRIGLVGRILVAVWVLFVVWIAGLFLLPKVFGLLPISVMALVALVLILASWAFLISRIYQRGLRRSRTG